MVYALAVLIASCLAGGQALWGSAVKAITATNTSVGVWELLTRLSTSGRFWLGATLYGIGTVVYLVLLSKAKFFSIQFTMTGVALLIALCVSYFIFKEDISLINFVGVVCIFAGIVLITH